MSFGNNFISKLWNPYHLAKATLLFNNMELKEIPITSGTDQGDLLSGIAFMISALPAFIKIQMTDPGVNINIGVEFFLSTHVIYCL
jgi:hypothetical protein